MKINVNKQWLLALVLLLALVAPVSADTFLPFVADSGPVAEGEGDTCAPYQAGVMQVWPEPSGWFITQYQWPVAHCARDPLVFITALGVSAPVGLESVSTVGVRSGFFISGRVDMSQVAPGEPVHLQYLAVKSSAPAARRGSFHAN